MKTVLSPGAAGYRCMDIFEVFIPFHYLAFFLKTYLFERARFHSLAHSSNGLKDWAGAILKQVARSLLWVSHIGGRAPNTCNILFFLMPLTLGWIRHKWARTQTDTHIGWWHYGQWFYMLCHNSDPISLAFDCNKIKISIFILMLWKFW